MVIFFKIVGYFTHVTTLGEVKEQVLKYIPVMARPMVMYRDKHPVIWTGVYADIEVSPFLSCFSFIFKSHKSDRFLMNVHFG